MIKIGRYNIFILVIYNPDFDTFCGYYHSLGEIYNSPRMCEPIFTVQTKEEVKNKIKEIEENQPDTIIQELIDAAEPFTSGDVVDEISSTIPLMERLKKAMIKAKEQILG